MVDESKGWWCARADGGGPYWCTPTYCWGSDTVGFTTVSELCDAHDGAGHDSLVHTYQLLSPPHSSLRWIRKDGEPGDCHPCPVDKVNTSMGETPPSPHSSASPPPQDESVRSTSTTTWSPPVKPIHAIKLGWTDDSINRDQGNHFHKSGSSSCTSIRFIRKGENPGGNHSVSLCTTVSRCFW